MTSPLPRRGPGLRTRLLISYLLLLGATLSVMLAAFLLLFNTRPAPASATYDQLSALAAQMPLTQLWDNWFARRFIPAPERLSLIVNELDQLADANDVRILLVNTEARIVLWDSDERFSSTDVWRSDYGSYTLPPGITDQLPRGGRGPDDAAALAGRFLDPDGAEWLFIGLERLSVGMIAQRDYMLLFASPRPTQNLRDTLISLGVEIIPVLVQAGLVGLGVAVALAVIISRSIAQPLLNVARGATEVAAGKPGAAVPLEGPPEVQAVAAAFNRMNAEVRAEQKSQQDFLANVSHDLKTPLTSIQGFSQAIIDGAAPDPVAAARIIYEEAGRMNRMVVELTDLARLQAGQMSLNLQPVDLSALTAAIAERLTVVAQEKRITLETHISPLPPVSGDGDRLAQVLMNLIGNAIKYTPADGHIWIRTAARASGVEVSVQDTGVGIRADELPRIFERFYQVDKARGPRRGTGLGLAIVQEIVTAHGGTVTAASPGEGRGSTFTLWLPGPVRGRK